MDLSREEWPYYWFWRKRLPERKGQPCRRCCAVPPLEAFGQQGGAEGEQ